MDHERLGSWIINSGGDPVELGWGEEKLQALILLAEIQFNLAIARLVEMIDEISMRIEALEPKEDPDGRMRKRCFELLQKLKIVEDEWRKNHRLANELWRGLAVEE